jgi:trk system potassium uptake protein TrkA
LNIVIFGATTLGRSIAEWLLNDWHEVSIIDNDALRLKGTEDQFGSIIIEGDATHQATLSLAGTSRADVFIAASDSESENMTSCQMAKELFNVKRTMCVVYSDENISLFQLLNIDSVINATAASLRFIKENLSADLIISLMDIPSSTPANLISIRIHQDSETIGKTLSDLNFPNGFSIKMIIRSGTVIENSVDKTMLRANDQVVAITDSINLDELKELFQ